ncbi:MAG: hypothetical protein KDD62_08230, partial [Bdellovibrionales bacterium]|nr:hypothetical protein [Bdellovibrionales bacterium]
GPVDVITEPGTGSLDANLGHAVARALQEGQSDACVAHAKSFTWEACTQVFFESLTPANI